MIRIALDEHGVVSQPVERSAFATRAARTQPPSDTEASCVGPPGPRPADRVTVADVAGSAAREGTT